MRNFIAAIAGLLLCALAFQPIVGAQRVGREAPALPWDIDEEKEYIVVGLKLEYELKLKGEKNVSLGCEVVKAGSEGFACNVTREGAAAETQRGWDGDFRGRTLEFEWGALAPLIKDTIVGGKKIKVGKAQVEATTYTRLQPDSRKAAMVLYLAPEYPGVVLKLERTFTNDRGETVERTLTLQAVHTLSEKLDELQAKLPVTEDSCRKYYKKGMKFTYEFVEGQKLMPGEPNPESGAVVFVAEVTEVAKTSHVQKAPVRWENGEPAEYASDTIQWSQLLDSYEDFLANTRSTASEGTITIGDKTYTCVNVTGVRNSGGFTDYLTLTYCKDFPAVLVFKKVLSVNDATGTQARTRLRLKSIS